MIKIKKSKLESSQGYSLDSHRLAFVSFSDDLGCYFITLIDGVFGADNKHTVTLTMTYHEAKQIAENWLNQSGT
jgi:hypothetical protein